MRMRKKKWTAPYLETREDVMVFHPEEYKGKWRELFNNNNPIYIEIGMGKGKFIIKDISFTEEKVFLTWKELIFYPFKSFEPNQLDRTSFIGEGSSQTRDASLPISFHIRYSTKQLIIDIIIEYLVNFMNFTTIDIAEGEIIEHILKGKDTEFFIKKFSTFRAYAF